MSNTPPQREDPTRPIWLQVGIGVLLFLLYIVVDLLGGPARRAAADRHAVDVITLERRLGLDVEGTLNRWLEPHVVLRTLASYEYAYGYIVCVVLLLLWVFRSRRQQYPLVRGSFVGLNVIGIAGFALYPLTPPRLLTTSGFTDTVSTTHTVGSWGSALVGHADTLAAMPSLHVAWAVWVSVMLAWLHGARWVQLLSAVHVALTCYVVMATANHYLLDAVAGIVVVWVSVLMAGAWQRRRSTQGRVVPSADAFFLDVESEASRQQVGGVALLAPSSSGGHHPAIDDVRRRVGEALADLPALRCRLQEGGWWTHPRWVEAPDLDVDWHVSEHHLPVVEAAGNASNGGGTRDGGTDDGQAPESDGDDSARRLRALHAYVAGLAATPLPRDRPLWRVVIVRGVAPGRSAMVLLAHHAIADGLGVVASALRFLDPEVALFRDTPSEAPGPVRRAGAAAWGLAQLATDGFPKASLSDVVTPARAFGVAAVDLDRVRAVARRHDCRVTDVLLCAVAGALARLRPDLAQRTGFRLRVAVPLVVAEPTAVTGNVTSAVMVDLPLEAVVEEARLARIAASTSRLRTPTRAFGSRLVMRRGLALAPRPLARWFARSVYGHRFFHAVVSNMSGPSEVVSLAGAELTEVVPVLPLAPGTPLSVGTLGWAGRFGAGVSTDPAVIDAEEMCRQIVRVIVELSGAEQEPQVDPGGPHTKARNSRAR